MNITWKIRPGQIPVNSIERVIDQPDVQIFEIDMVSKYPHTTYGGGGPNGITIYLLAGENTLYVDKNEPAATGIDFEGHDFTGWHVIIDGVGRYTVRVCLYQDSRP